MRKNDSDVEFNLAENKERERRKRGRKERVKEETVAVRAGRIKRKDRERGRRQ